MYKKILAFSFVGAIALTVAFVARPETAHSVAPTVVTPVEAKRVEEPKDVQTEDEPRVVSLEVTPNGFEPRETDAPRGKFLILLQNRTGRRDLSFYLVRANRERLAESNPQKRDWKAQLELGPGTYIVGETNHPEWQSIIRVTN